MLWILLSILFIVAISIIAVMNQPKFGKTPQGERLERIKKSPHYQNGQFKNLSETKQLTSEKGFISSVFEFLFRDKKSLEPQETFPVIKTDLIRLDPNKDLLIWFGHSSYLIQIDGKRILVDPVFCTAAPFSFINKPFEGTAVYNPEDIPEIDYLVITHDHWDHLDYETVIRLKDRTKKIVCGLGVGEHFEYWGFPSDKIIELDWYEKAVLKNGFSFYCLPTRHFSGRSFSPNQSLWTSYMLETPSQHIYIGGDGGYDSHFAEIGKQFPDIDLAILENGQYDPAWKYIHLMPEQLVTAAKDLNAKKLLTVHHAKYALANHPWDSPLENIYEANKRDHLHLITPRIGEIVLLKDNTQNFKKWW